MSEQTVYRLATEFDKEYPREKASRLARRAVKSLTASDREEILTGLLASEIEAIRRQRSREIERRAWEIASAEQVTVVERERREYKREVAKESKAFREAMKRRDDEAAELFRTDPEAHRRKYTLGGIIEAWEEKIAERAKMELTAELLTAVFATGDGRRVTWGEATLEDHRKRIELLARGVKGSVETIRLHEYAASILRETGATCLNNAKVAVA